MGGDLDPHLAQLPLDRDIILYSTWLNEASAARGARMLIDRGYTRMRPLTGGLDAWGEVGFDYE